MRIRWYAASSQDDLQNRRFADAGVNGGMRASKHQRQPAVGNLPIRGESCPPPWRSAPGPRPPGRWCGGAGPYRSACAGPRQQPCFRIRRDPLCGQSASADAKASDGASSAAATSSCACRKKGDELAVAAACIASAVLRPAPRLCMSACMVSQAVACWRLCARLLSRLNQANSTTPWPAPGQGRPRREQDPDRVLRSNNHLPAAL